MYLDIVYKNSMVMFSVVIPLYNKERSIQSTLRSVLNQTVQDFEVVVVNDGCTDASLAKVKEMNDPRIRIVDKPNGGVSSARNRGVQEAKYDWIALLDGDDLWKQNHLQEFLKMTELFPCEKVFATSFEFSDKSDTFRHPRKAAVSKIENYFKEAQREYLLCSSNVLLHKACFQTTGCFNVDINRGEDLDFWARLARYFTLVKSVQVTAVYRVEAENRSDRHFDLHKNMIYHYNFGTAHTHDEFEYYKRELVKKLKWLLLTRRFCIFFVLYVKHIRFVGFVDLTRKILIRGRQ